MDTRTSPDITMTDAPISNDSHNNEKASSLSLLDDLSEDIKQEELYPRSPLRVLGLLAQTSQRYETETAFLRLIPSTVDAEPESYKDYDLALITQNKLQNKTVEYQCTTTGFQYRVIGLDGQQKEAIIPWSKLPQVPNNDQDILSNKNKFLPAILEQTSKSGHTQQADETRLAAIAILKRHPELLFKTSQVMDHFGRQIKGSPYQIFLGAGDIWALKQVHEEIIAKIEDQEARASAEAQTKAEFQTQFPDYSGPWPLDPNMLEEVLYDKRNKEQIEQVKAQLKIIVEKITADPCTNGQATKDETTKAVAELCKIFAPEEGEVIKTGLHFPLGILKEIGKVYDTQFAPWSGDQLAFFSREVIGGAVASLSTVDGQCVKNGLANLNMEKGPDRRDGLFCHRPKGIPQELAPLVGKLGRTMFVDPFDGYSCFVSSTLGSFDWYNKNGVRFPLAIACWRRLDSWRVQAWKTYGEQKQSRMAAIMQPRAEKSTHRLAHHDQPKRCVIL